MGVVGVGRLAVRTSLCASVLAQIQDQNLLGG